MKQLGGVEEIYSALYVDFDNIYHALIIGKSNDSWNG